MTALKNFLHSLISYHIELSISVLMRLFEILGDNDNTDDKRQDVFVLAATPRKGNVQRQCSSLFADKTDYIIALYLTTQNQNSLTSFGMVCVMFNYVYLISMQYDITLCYKLSSKFAYFSIVIITFLFHYIVLTLHSTLCYKLRQ